MGADAAESGWSARWRYWLPGLVLETTWSGPTGDLVVVDAMALGPRERGHELGHAAPGVLLRRVCCTHGSVPVRVEFVPRPEFGLVHPRLVAGSGAVIAHGGASIVVLSSNADLDLDPPTAGAYLSEDEAEGREVGVRGAAVRRVGPAAVPVDRPADPVPPHEHRGDLAELVAVAPTL